MKKISKIIVYFVSTVKKTFAIKSIQRSVFFFFLNPSRRPKNKIYLFSISVFFKFRFIYKTITKQTVSEQFRKKKPCTEISISEAVCLLNATLLERSDDLPNKHLRYTSAKWGFIQMLASLFHHLKQVSA